MLRHIFIIFVFRFYFYCFFFLALTINQLFGYDDLQLKFIAMDAQFIIEIFSNDLILGMFFFYLRFRLI